MSSKRIKGLSLLYGGINGILALHAHIASLTLGMERPFVLLFIVNTLVIIIILRFKPAVVSKKSILSSTLIGCLLATIVMYCYFIVAFNMSKRVGGEVFIVYFIGSFLIMVGLPLSFSTAVVVDRWLFLKDEKGDDPR